MGEGTIAFYLHLPLLCAAKFIHNMMCLPKAQSALRSIDIGCCFRLVVLFTACLQCTQRQGISILSFSYPSFMVGCQIWMNLLPKCQMGHPSERLCHSMELSGLHFQISQCFRIHSPSNLHGLESLLVLSH